MKTITIKKQNFVHLYNDIIRFFVWRNDECVITIHSESDKSYFVSSEGAFGLVEIPKSAINID
jgi:hypothetical protein